MVYVCLLSFCSGLLSLSLEILWIRLFGFVNHSLPQTFAFVLVWFLLGIAIGAYIGKQYCRSSSSLWAICGVFFLLTSILAFLFAPCLYVISLQYVNQLITSAIIIACSAALIAVLFPILHHLGAEVRGSSANTVSRIYAANILGATLGPLLTGSILLNLLTTQQCFLLFASVAFLLGMSCLIKKLNQRALLIIILVIACLLGWNFSGNPHWLIAKADHEKKWLANVIENAQGIITVYHGGEGGDIIAGGNVYDGRTNLNPTITSNGLNRLLILSALHDHPKRVLIIGLSIGTWLKLITAFPDVQTIDVIEINPGYLDAIKHYPAQQSALADRRVNLYIDDGRRWLRANAERKYDMIIMNTTYHWRAYSTNLLSYEFLTLVKQHMLPNAIVAFNTTNSLDSTFTAANVFQHAYLYMNFIIAADYDWRFKLQSPSSIDKLMQLKLDGRSLFTAAQRSLVWEYLHFPIKTVPELSKRYESFGRTLEVVTDDNVITEYKYGKVLQNTFPY